MIVNYILVGLAYGSGAVFCAIFIAPRAKTGAGVTIAILIILFSIAAIIATIYQAPEGGWLQVFKLIAIGGGAIATAIWAREEGL